MPIYCVRNVVQNNNNNAATTIALYRLIINIDEQLYRQTEIKQVD